MPILIDPNSYAIKNGEMELKYGDYLYIPEPKEINYFFSSKGRKGSITRRLKKGYQGWLYILVKRNDKPELDLDGDLWIDYYDKKDKYYRIKHISAPPPIPEEKDDDGGRIYLEKPPTKLINDAEYVIEGERYKLDIKAVIIQLSPPPSPEGIYYFKGLKLIGHWELEYKGFQRIITCFEKISSRNSPQRRDGGYGRGVGKE